MNNGEHLPSFDDDFDPEDIEEPYDPVAEAESVARHPASLKPNDKGSHNTNNGPTQ